MRSGSLGLAAVALALASTFSPVVRAADEVTWKLVAVQLSDQDLFLIKTKSEDGKTTAEVTKSGIPQLGDVKLTAFEQKGDKVTLTLTLQGGSTFTGTTAKDGKVYGTLKLPGGVVPVRLEKGDSLAPTSQPAYMPKLMAAMQNQTASPKERVASLVEILKGADGPGYAMLFGQVLSLAPTADVPADEVKGYVEKWLSLSKPYGVALVNDVRIQVVKALGTKATYAPLAFELALEAEKTLPPESSPDQQAEIVGILARSAKAVGKVDIAKTAEERLAKLESKLDAEYHEKVPPFKPAAFEGRTNKKADKVVLMELFTGAQCPPCVAADVGYDALLTSFKPTEFIGLQYHLHIPGPDPLTNAASEAREEYYKESVRGTPSTFFNGKSEAGGGGGMANSEGKYSEFKEVIEKILGESKTASIDLTATRAGDVIKITAKASTDAKVKDAKPTLRLVLVEDEVKYTGGNKLRFHHHVVRSFPGGAAGVALEAGEAKQALTVNLVDVRAAQDEYNIQKA